MTIFGFNTDARHGGVTYHVQSEARANDLLLQSLIFVQGQCVGKSVFSYAENTLQANFSEDAIHELLKAQHKTVIDAVHLGQAGSFSNSGEAQDVGGSGLSLKWTNPSQERQANTVVMRLQVFDLGQAVAMAEVMVWPCAPARTVEVARAHTDAAGIAALVVPVTGEIERDSAVMVRATRKGKSATRKFRFRKQFFLSRG